MLSLQKMQSRNLSPNMIIESEMMSIKWQLRFLAEAAPEWVNCGSGITEDAASGIGNILDKIADQVEALSDFWMESNGGAK